MDVEEDAVENKEVEIKKEGKKEVEKEIQEKMEEVEM